MENKIKECLESSIKSLNEVVDVNTVIGKEVVLDRNIKVIPFCKVLYGSINGGGEYGDVKIFKKGKDSPFASGGGALVSIKPSGFLIEDNGKFSILEISESGYEKVFNSVVDKISAFGDKIEKE